MIRQIHIPRGLATAIVGDREKSPCGYNVNKVIRAVDLYLCLKSESHKIHDYNKQLPDLLQLCKCSRGTFFARLKLCKQLGLIEAERGNLMLKGWATLSEIFLYRHTGTITVNYDTTKEGQKVQYYLKALEIQENKERQLFAIAQKRAKNSELEATFIEFCQFEGIEADFSPQAYQLAREHAFAAGTDSRFYDNLQAFNTSVSRNVKTIAIAHGYKNWQGAAYVKQQLVKRGLVDIVRPTPVKCNYKGADREHGIKKGSTKYGRYYNIAHKTVLWYKPDEITPNSALFAPETRTETKAQNQAAGRARPAA